MSELLNLIQTSNGAFMSDLMKGFVAEHKGDFPQCLTGTGTGAGNVTSSSTTTTAAGVGLDDTDNANILMQKRETDNMRTPNANLNTKTTTTPSSALAATPHLTSPSSSSDPNANVAVDAVVAGVKAVMPENVQTLVQQLTDDALEAFRVSNPASRQAVRDAADKCPLPDLSKMSLSSGSMWDKMTANMMPNMVKVIKFCKMLPGFCELPQEDQVKLVKLGSFEVMMARFMKHIDHEKETMIDPSLKMLCPRQVVRATPMGAFLDSFFQLAAQFNPLDLTDDEVGLFTAVLVFCPSRPGLSDVKLVSTIQSLYYRALYHRMKQNHSDAEDKFSKLLNQMPMFRRIGEEHTKAVNAIKTQNPEVSKQFPPMHKEIVADQ